MATHSSSLHVSFPYSFRGNGRRVRWRREGNICVTVWGNGKPVMRKMRENTQDGAQGSWFKVTVSILKKYGMRRREKSGGVMLFSCWDASLFCWGQFVIWPFYCLVNSLVHLRKNSEKQYKGNRPTVRRTLETISRQRHKLLIRIWSSSALEVSVWLAECGTWGAESLETLSEGQAVSALGRISWNFIKERSSLTPWLIGRELWLERSILEIHIMHKHKKSYQWSLL